jgi:DNA-binding XRE family transcriptional regulator
VTPAEKLAKKKTRKRAARNQANRLLGIHRCSIREIREAIGISLNDAAKGVGISPAGMSVIERGSDVTLSTMKKLVVFYGKGLDELWPRGL